MERELETERGGGGGGSSEGKIKLYSLGESVCPVHKSCLSFRFFPSFFRTGTLKR